MATGRKPIEKYSSTVFPYRGKFRVQYFDAQGRVRTKTAETLKDGYKLLALLEQQVNQGLHQIRVSDLPTLSEWLDSWYESRRSEVSPLTLWSFESTIRLHIKPELGHLRLDKVTSLQIQKLYLELAERKGLSQGSVYKVHATLNHAFGIALKGGLVNANPLARVKPPKPLRKPIQTLSGEEVRRLLEASTSLGPESAARWFLSLRLGLRQGECLALTWSDVDLEQGVVAISKTVNTVPGRGIIFMPPKSKQSDRVVPCDEETLNNLKNYFRATGNSRPQNLLFPGENGNPRDASVDYRNWRKLLAIAEVKSVRLHDARHSSATLMLAGGADVRSIQLVLGHSSPAFTMATYLHPSTDSLRAAVQKGAQHKGPLGS